MESRSICVLLGTLEPYPDPLQRTQLSDCFWDYIRYLRFTTMYLGVHLFLAIYCVFIIPFYFCIGTVLQFWDKFLQSTLHSAQTCPICFQQVLAGPAGEVHSSSSSGPFI